MYTTFLVVDDFLDNADALRAHALALNYPEQQGQFPGRNSLQRVNIEGLTEAVSRIVGERLVAAPPPQIGDDLQRVVVDDGRAVEPILVAE